MTTELILLTYNRLEFTKLALGSILADPLEDFSLTIWDNGSTDETPEFLRNEVRDPRIKTIVYSKQNVGQIAAVNKVWSDSKADLVGKLDNDCLVTPGWTRTLAQAHEDITELGVVACWHFFPEDFDYQKAKPKIQSFGKHQIMRHAWTCGTGLLLKRATYERLGPIKGDGTTQYWLQVAKAGYVNGFYYPLVFQDHMDDPRSRHNRSRSVPFEEAYKHTFGWQAGAFSDAKTYDQLHHKILDNLLTGSYDPNDYLRPFWKRAFDRVRKLHRNRLKAQAIKGRTGTVY